MKKGSILTTFIAIHISFIFLQIHKHMQFIKQSFEKQKNERLFAQLIKEKQALANQLHTLQNKNDIKQFAQEHLHMKSVSLKQMKRIDYDN